MVTKERIHSLVEELPAERLEEAERMLRSLATHDELDQPRRYSPRDERRDRVRSFRGSVAHLPGSVDEFLREKHKDTEREEARLERQAA